MRVSALTERLPVFFRLASKHLSGRAQVYPLKTSLRPDPMTPGQTVQPPIRELHFRP
jgi:hypothetical protein